MVQNNHKTSTPYSFLVDFFFFYFIFFGFSCWMQCTHMHIALAISLLSFGDRQPIFHSSSSEHEFHSILALSHRSQPTSKCFVRLALTPAFNFENSDSSTDYNFLSFVSFVFLLFHFFSFRCFLLRKCIFSTHSGCAFKYFSRLVSFSFCGVPFTMSNCVSEWASVIVFIFFWASRS